MVKPIKFPLIMADGIKVHTIKELKQNFSLEKVLSYYVDGKLLTWLNNRHYDVEASVISQLDRNSPNFYHQICKVFGVENNFHHQIDLEAVENRISRIVKLKQFTDDEEIIQQVDAVVFDQKELDLIEDKTSQIYLCGKEFIIPLNKENVTYVGIGVNVPQVIITSSIPVDFTSKHIVFQNVIFDSEYFKLTQAAATANYARVVKVQYKTSPLLGYMMNKNDRFKSQQLFTTIYSGLSGCVFNIDRQTKSTVELLKNAELDKIFSSNIEKIVY